MRSATTPTMSLETGRILYAKLFFGIFFMKILISCSPFFFSHVDKETILQVVLQLEIENNNGSSSDQAKDFAKEYPKPATHLSYLPPLEFFNALIVIVDDSGFIPAFYPSVPTPPPNA